MKHLALAAALCAASPALAQPNSAGWSAGDASDNPPLVTPQPRQLVQPWPVLAPYPRTVNDAPAYFPAPLLNASEQRIKQLEQHNRLLMLQFQQRIFEDALRLPRR